MKELKAQKHYDYYQLLQHIPEEKVKLWLQTRREEAECGQNTLHETQNWLCDQIFNQSWRLQDNASEEFPLDYAAYKYFTEEFQDKKFPTVVVYW